MSRIITVTSGKGGVGKTNLSTNLAIHLASLGHKTCMFDADLGLANINILLGINPENTLYDVIYNNIDLPDIVIKDCYGIDIIPGSSGIEDIANIDRENLDRLINSFSMLDDYEFLFFDTGAGISNDILSFCLATNEIIIVITPEPTSLTDSYALLKVLKNNGFDGYVRVIVNQCKNTAIAKKTYTGFKEVIIKYLSAKVQPLGVILEDPNIQASVREQKPFIDLYPDTVSSKCLKAIAKNLIKKTDSDLETHNLQSFWNRCLDNFKARLTLEGKQPEKTPAVIAAAETAENISPPQQEEVQKTAEQPEEEIHEAVSAPETEELKPVHIHNNVSPEYPETDDVKTLMKDLIETVASVSAEIKSLRNALVQDNNIRRVADRIRTETPNPEDLPEKIILDFNSFIKKQKVIEK